MTLADIVIGDARTATVFDRLGLDYCCRGHQTLAEAAGANGVSLPAVVDELARLSPPLDEADALAAELDLPSLTRHVVSRHHGYVREATPQLRAWLAKLVNRHGARHRELEEVRDVFDALSNGLESHMLKEESVLFPFIEAMAEAASAGMSLPPGPFGTILNPIRAMKAEHREAGEQVERLRRLTSVYQPPADACMTYRLCYGELARFEGDLHRHVHLENHVLFSRALALETTFS